METSISVYCILAIIIALGTAHYLQSMGSVGFSPMLNTLVIPFIVAVVSFYAFAFLFPKLNTTAQNVSDYVENKTYNSVNSMNYLQIFPPLLIILIIFFIFIFNKSR